MTGPSELALHGVLTPTLARSQPHPLVPTWLCCDLVTGDVVCELPQLTPQGVIGRRLGETATASFNIALDPDIDPGWIAGTQPGRSLLVCVVQGAPIWSGIVIGPRERGSATTATLTTISPEGYLDRRYVGDHPAYTEVEWWEPAQAYLQDVGGFISIDIGTDIYTPPSVSASATAAADDQTVWDAITSLMQSGAPEVVVDTMWAPNTTPGTQVALVARVRPHIGYFDAAAPRAVFDLPGCVTAYSQAESYEAGKGATSILAEGNGQSSGRVTSGTVLATEELAAGWPLWEYRWSPAQASAEPIVLQQQAQQAIALMAEGSSIWTVTAAASRAPVPGIDWDLGDRVALVVAAADPTAGWPGSPGHPQGVSVQCRVWGWDLDLVNNAVTPILAEDSEGGY